MGIERAGKMMGAILALMLLLGSSNPEMPTAPETYITIVEDGVYVEARQYWEFTHIPTWMQPYIVAYGYANNIDPSYLLAIIDMVSGSNPEYCGQPLLNKLNYRRFNYEGAQRGGVGYGPFAIDLNMAQAYQYNLGTIRHFWGNTKYGYAKQVKMYDNSPQVLCDFIQMLASGRMQYTQEFEYCALEIGLHYNEFFVSVMTAEERTELINRYWLIKTYELWSEKNIERK